MHHKNVGEIQESLNDFLIISENKMVPNDWISYHLIPIL
jgi:hypothetical protein